VLNEQHGNAPVADGPDGMHQGSGLLIVHAACGFVQNHEARVGGQGAGYLKQALVAVRKAACGLGIAIGKTHKFQLFHAAGNGGSFFLALTRRVQHARYQAGFHAAVPPGQHVFQHRKAAKEADGLERAGDAQFHHLVRAQSGNGFAVKKDAARLRRIVAGYAVEHGGLASAVGADKPHNAASVNVKGKIVQGNQAAEHLAHFFKAQQGHAGLPSLAAIGGASTL